MVQMKKCDCDNRIGLEISSRKAFHDLNMFFTQQVENKVFREIPVTEAFYVGIGKYENIVWFATKWFKCNVCGCLWEFDYPDFPASGFVRKFENGVHNFENNDK